jgi:hypothetical protein
MATEGGPNIVTDGLVLHLDAANPKSYPGTGVDWYDVSSGNYHSQLSTNGVSFQDGYLSFNGIDQTASHNGLPLVDLSTELYTMELWFKLPNLPTAEIQFSGNGGTPIYGKAVGNDYMIFAYAAVEGRSALGVSYDDSRNDPIHRSTYTIAANEWVQFVHIGTPYYDPVREQQRGYFRYYVNGQLDTPDTVSADVNTYAIPTNFNIAKDGRWGDFGEVDLACIKRYNRALTPQEVLQNYNATKSRFNL